MHRAWLLFASALVLAVCIAPCGCKSLAVGVGKSLGNTVAERVSELGNRVEDLEGQTAELAAVAAEKFAQLPVLGIVFTLACGGALAILAAFKWPTLVDEVIVATIGLAGILIAWTYRAPILWTALAAATGLLGWKLIRKHLMVEDKEI